MEISRKPYTGTRTQATESLTNWAFASRQVITEVTTGAEEVSPVLIHAVDLVDRMVHALVARMQPPPQVHDSFTAFPAETQDLPQPGPVPYRSSWRGHMPSPLAVFGLRAVHTCE